ncbi:MAG: polyphosphate polymerase domain-containing protein [Anaerolineales bacterium]|nr:polyphosphate polymerase domain-containing protein [Anaerolineales bacterium]
MLPFNLDTLKKTYTPALKNGTRKMARPHTAFVPLLASFAPISLAQMAGVALLDRMDTKYVMSETQLYQALTTLREEYWVLDINAVRLNQYRTLYFDTADFMLYHRHHAGGHNRYKVRSREYVDSHLSFLEIKYKAGNARTLKSRLQTPALLTQFSADTHPFMDAHFPFAAEYLEPKLWNEYVRVTLVNKHAPERLTLDLNLRFYNDEHTVSLPGVAIAEVKQAGHNPRSPFFQQMRAMNLRPMGFSKYCMGVTMLYPEVKANHFKPQLREIENLVSTPNFM